MRLKPLLAGLIALAGAAPALGQSGASFDVSWSTRDGGGGTSSGGGWSLSATVAQVDAGPGAGMSGGGWSLVGGFWPGMARPCFADCNKDGTLTVADFGCFQTKFAVGAPYADCNADGTLTVADFGCFQSKFVAGCH